MIAKIAKITALGLAFVLAAGAGAYLTLTLIIKSEDTVIVPNLVGKDVVSALEILTELKLNTKVSGSEYSRQFPKNHVTFQEPDAGSEIKSDRDIRIIISKGPKTILMPNIVNLSEQQARMIIEENGFTQGQMSHTYNDSIEASHVILQVPSAGTKTTRGTSVDILVSSGPRPIAYVMPELSGHSLDQAVLIIENTDMTVGKIRSRFDKRNFRNMVISQDPPAGYSVNVSDPVHLVINRPSGRANGDRLHRPLYGSLLQHRIKSGFLKKHVRIEMENAKSTTDLFDDYVRAGHKIWVLIPRDHEASVFIFENDELVTAHLYEAW